MPDLHPDDAKRAARLLDAHPDYRVLRALPQLDQLVLPAPEGKQRMAIVLDTETTSLDAESGRIIELAMCPVTFDSRGRIIAIGPVLDWLEDPGEPLTPDIAHLTGLTDIMLTGQRIHDATALKLLSDADLIVAHNASFDAAWIERRYPQIKRKPWCCSVHDIPWREHGHEARTLGALLADVAGYFNTRHRADADVAALVALLVSHLPSGRQVCSDMILRAQRPTIRVIAENAPFAVKDALKARAYKWDQKLKSWCFVGTSDAADAECAWLVSEGGCSKPKLEQITWHRRHRA